MGRGNDRQMDGWWGQTDGKVNNRVQEVEAQEAIGVVPLQFTLLSKRTNIEGHKGLGAFL